MVLILMILGTIHLFLTYSIKKILLLNLMTYESKNQNISGCSANLVGYAVFLTKQLLSSVVMDKEILTYFDFYFFSTSALTFIDKPDFLSDPLLVLTSAFASQTPGLIDLFIQTVETVSLINFVILFVSYLQFVVSLLGISFFDCSPC